MRTAKLSGFHVWFSMLVLALPGAVQAQFNHLINNGTITITEYTGPGGDVTIPSTINGLPVTAIGSYYNPLYGWLGAFQGSTNLSSIMIPDSIFSIGDSAFAGCSLSSARIGNSVTNLGNFAFYSCFSLTNVTIGNNVATIGQDTFAECLSLPRVTIPNSVTSIGPVAFYYCPGLTNVTMGDGVIRIGGGAFLGTGLTSITIPNSISSIEGGTFQYCDLLARVTIGNSVTNIGTEAFLGCRRLTTVTIPNTVTSIGDSGFEGCINLTGVLFKGDAPSLGGTNVFAKANNVTVYYLLGTTGWGPAFAGRPTALWNPLMQAGTSFGARSNQFGFNVTGAANIQLVVEAGTNLASPAWSQLQTIALTNGLFNFNDPQWMNYAVRFYRLRSP